MAAAALLAFLALGASPDVPAREGDRPVIRASPGFAEAHALRPAPGVAVRP